MEENPYQSPLQENRAASPKAGWRRGWLAWAAFAWLVFLLLHVPSISYTSRTPAGAFLGYKIATAMMSMIAVVLLTFIPRGWWKALTIPIAVLLVLIETGIWIRLP